MASFAIPDSQARIKVSEPRPSGSAATTVSQKIEFLDLKVQFASIREEVMRAITSVMESQQFIMGSEVKLLEEELAAMLDADDAIACASGSDALVLALMALGIGNGDEVITSPFTFFATAGSIARVGAKPVFVDIDPETFNIDTDQIQGAITRQTRAIMPVHLFGQPAELDAILRLAASNGLAVIEDAAQAIGARYGDRYVGTLAEFGCFSFFPSKNLGGAGDGGLITTQNKELADKVRLLRVHGSKQKYHHLELGVNSRLDALQAAILRVKLRHLEDWTQGRRARAERYRALFEAAGLARKVTVPTTPRGDMEEVYNQFVVRCSERDALRDYLRGRQVMTEIYYPISLHLQPAFAYLGYKAGQFPHSEAACRETLALPIYPELKEQEQATIVGAIADFYEGRR